MRGIEGISTKTFQLDNFTKEEVIETSLQTAFEAGLPLAMWRMPNQNEINLVISLEDAVSLDTLDLEDLPKGFLFTPFDFPSKAARFIKADISFSFDFGEIVSNLLEKSELDKKNQFLQSFIEASENTNRALIPHQGNIHSKEGLDYKELVEVSVEEIKKGTFDKVVPARTKRIELSDDFDLTNYFFDLASSYENAFVSLVSIPEVGTWIGATPETLIEVSKGYFKTVSLAGTQKFKDLESLTNTAWTQKEIEEQAMVSRYIINCFKKIRLREFKEIGPKTVKAGNLVHLKTTFEVDTEATNFAELGNVMLDLLHPTSAVAGMPKEEALQFLQKFEGLDRGFYAGYLGPVDHLDKTHVFVNLRCLQVLENEAILYAGAGVTEDSDPEKEYLETELKFNTLLNIMNKPK